MARDPSICRSSSHRSTAGEFWWQEDNAKPHLGVRDELKKSLGRGKPKGRMREQPARSPDVNVLDLVVWRILEAKVHAREPKTKDELLQACVDAWNKDLRAEHLELAFRLLHVVRRQIIEKKGGNNFRIKHTGIRKQMKAEGFDISE